MQTAENWKMEPVQDKLNIFVSSRLQECADERRVAREAIRATNNHAVLFEHLGARSVKPRDLYLSRLRESQFMVAIYRQGYGYIDDAGGMTISGLEDEFLYAQAHGIPTLIYVFADDAERDARLKAMIERASPNFTMFFYRDPAELERIKDDVTAEIARAVLMPDVARGVLQESSAELLSRAAKRQGELLERSGVLAEVTAVTSNAPVLCIYGPAGIGKTTLAAQFSQRIDGTYLRVSALAPRDLFSVCVSALRGSEAEASTFTTLQGATLGFAAAWADIDNIRLVIDECDFIDELMSAIQLGGGISSTKQLVFTSREPHPDFPGFAVPSLTPGEIQALISASGSPVSSVALSPQATPLQVQSLIVEDAATSNPTGPVGSEIVCYLAISPSPIMADELLTLLGDDTLGIEALYAEINKLGRVVDDSPRGFRLMHAATADAYAEELKYTPQRLRFYTNRLIEIFEARGDYRQSFQVAKRLSNGAEERYALPAVRQSIQLGDVKTARLIAEDVLTTALDAERRGDAFELMLSLTYPLELMGDVERAKELLDAAEELATGLGEHALRLVSEAKIGSSARRTLAEGDVEGLQRIRDEYAKAGEKWDAARVSVELSALFLASKAYEKAVEVLRPALKDFIELGDDYGIDLAERNLVSALSDSKDNDLETDRLLQRISERSSGNIDPRRQRAWYCNLLTRRYRNSGKLAEAEEVAKEAISISADLGDESLSALTYINLGNVYRDMRDVPRALEAYDQAAKIAQACGRRDIEADGSRLRAGVLNDIDESAKVVSDRHEQAKLFAQHAIGLLQGTIYYEALARSLVELADAEEALDDVSSSSRSYFRAAENFRRVPDEEGYEFALAFGAERALREEDDQLYVEELSKAFSFPVDPTLSVGDHFFQLIRPIIAQTPRDKLVRLLGLHLRRMNSQLPPLLRTQLLEALTEIVDGQSRDNEHEIEGWRHAYAGFLAPYLARDNERQNSHRRLASAITRHVPGLNVRHTLNGDQIWTVVLELDQPIVLTIIPLDETVASSVAAQSLALFFKSFESEIKDIVGTSGLREITIQVSRFDEMPGDIQEMAIRMFDLDEMLDDQSSAVTRTTDFSGATPMMAFLHPEFLLRTRAGEGIGGSLQSLFGLAMVELVFLLLRGQVDHDAIRPKVVSLVRRTLS